MRPHVDVRRSRGVFLSREHVCGVRDGGANGLVAASHLEEDLFLERGRSRDEAPFLDASPFHSPGKDESPFHFQVDQVKDVLLKEDQVKADHLREDRLREDQVKDALLKEDPLKEDQEVRARPD